MTDDEEFDLGTDPFDPDTDRDGIADGSDPSLIADIVEALPREAFKRQRTYFQKATLRRLRRAERHLLLDRTAPAVRQLESLRRRIDGCLTEPVGHADRNDWIVDCGAQQTIRPLLERIIDNLQRRD